MGKKTIMAFFAGLIAVIMTAFCTVSCDFINTEAVHRSDSVRVAQLVDNELNKSFTNADLFSTYALNEGKYLKFVDLVNSLDIRTVRAIAQRVIDISPDNSVTWIEFLDEYSRHEDMYQSFERSLNLVPATSETKPDISDKSDTLTSEEHIIQELQKYKK